MNIAELPDILKRYEIDDTAWARIQENSRFRQLLSNAIEEWHSALNTSQRIKVKSAALLELWLEHANELLHRPGEGISGKTELAKLLARLAEVGLTNVKTEGGGGERFSLTINLGASQLRIEKEVPAKVIEHDPTQEP